MTRMNVVITVLAIVATVALAGNAAARARNDFTNTRLISTAPLGITTSPNANSTGNSEPAIAFGTDGTMAVDGLAWLPGESTARHYSAPGASPP